MTTTNATNEQLELGFNPDNQCRGANAARHEGRIARANWWFAKMREAVSGAMDWQPEAQPRPEQIWIPGANRQLKV